MRIGLVHSTIREDEKLLIKSAKERRLEMRLIDIREQVLNPSFWKERFEVVLERCISTTLGNQAVIFFESLGQSVVNSSAVASVCENKFLTSLKLKENEVPIIPFALAFDEAGAIRAVEQLGGYPVVIKPVLGSWGRLLAKINDRDALEAVIEQKMVLGSPSQKILYLQKYVEKPGRDIRVTTAGDKVICAIYREANHWITNTARGAEAKSCPMNKDLEEISLKAARAVGGGVLGIDVFETERGYLINEVNHTTEFKNVQRVTGIDVSGAIIDYCLTVIKQ